MKKILSLVVLFALAVAVRADDQQKKKPSAGASHAGAGASHAGGVAPKMSGGPGNFHMPGQSSASHSGPGNRLGTASHSGALHSNPSGHQNALSKSGTTANASHTSNPLLKNNASGGATAAAKNPLTKTPGHTAVANAMTKGQPGKAIAHPAVGANHFVAHPVHANYQVRPYREVFGSYHREFHDRGWYAAHYDNVVVVNGGYYYWNGGYWYPAWGYDPAVAFYAFDGPIYSYNNLPPDQVVVNVQTSLQDNGYYTGQIDGQLGPDTRDAVGAYQKDHDLEVTSAIDEPTVDSLGLS